ncbi:IclR family transcriptional regulator C-terminal domain-containing protein [uncultured Tateyamaria sp.]|uniref:IclR family transcriptional regulator domain-containing protein n=1 Tax=uncultured Tateyamaria sp. TaxID=455651 RepID=UPI0026208679|nr:IclR family transcriptional regulator C-terminal domain-containing protein [uncultured Tateyamaria sp.]
MPIKNTDFLGSFAKGLAVIEAFSGETTRLTVSDVARLTSLDRSAARRCLLTLAELGYAKYDGKYFSLTPKVLRLGVGALAAMPLPQIIQPWLDQLSNKIGESVSASILDETEIVYVARAAQHRVMSIGVMPGFRLPAHSSSMGRVLLAALPADEVSAVLERSDLSPKTVHSISDLDAILHRIQRARENEYECVDQEIEIGLRSIAVPIYSSHDKVIAAINVGVSAAQRGVENLIAEVLPELCAIQKNVRGLLR